MLKYVRVKAKSIKEESGSFFHAAGWSLLHSIPIISQLIG